MSEQTAPNGDTKQQILFDADAPQRIPFNVEHEGELYEIAFNASPLTDELTRQYESRRNVRQAGAEADDGLEGIVTKSDSDAAGAWLFDVLMSAVEGVEESGEDWKSQFDVLEKAGFIEQSLFAVEVVAPPKTSTGKPLPRVRRGGEGAVRLRAIFSGRIVETVHRLRDADADLMREYASIMGRGVLVQGSKLGRREIYVPSRAGRLGEIYDGLKVSATGYAGRVPLHHKMAVVVHHLSRQQEAVAKN
jgi:hypothetical protein